MDETMINRKLISMLITLLLLLLLPAATAEEAGSPIVQALPTAVPVTAPTAEPEVPAPQTGDQTGSIRILVFNDKNNNGEQGPYEEGVAGIRVYVLAEDSEQVFWAGETNADGEALAEGLAQGRYRIRSFVEGDWGYTEPSAHSGLTFSCVGRVAEADATSEPMAVKAGEETGCGVAIAKMIFASGFCWLDADGDGVCREGESRVAGVRITLEGQKNGLWFETTSLEDGTWRIDRVRPGFYTITAYAPDGMMFTRYSKFGGKNRSIFTAEGVSKAEKTLDTNDKVSRDDLNIGFMWGSRIVGRCFLDANYNGMYDEGEQPLAGVKLAIGKQMLDTEFSTVRSGEDGTFVINGLRGNTYKIRAVLPEDGSDFTRVVSDPLGNHFKARPGRRENYWENYEVGDGVERVLNVGAIYPGSVSGTVYFDNDFSATLNGKEKVVSGFTVSLLDENGETVATDKTSVKGVYELTALPPGTYSLKVTANPGYAFTRTGEGNVILNRTGGEGYSEPFSLPLGEHLKGLDIGMILPASVTGTVFADADDNGLMDAGETGMTGTVVKLLEEDETEAFRAEIGENGAFLFDAVMPGRYCLEYELPERAVFAKTAAGGNSIESEDGKGRGEWFEIRSGDALTAELCGALTLGRVEGIVFRDPDANGVAGAEEEPLAGAEISLIPQREDLEAVTVTTAEDGAFLLERLHPDTYTLTVTVPEGRVISRTDALDLPLEPGKAEQSAELSVSMGQERNGQSIGAVMPAGLKGRIWMDENNNGAFDEGEATPARYEITVTDEGNGSVFSTLRTDDEGRFETAGMIPGSFSLSYELDSDELSAPEGDSTFRQAGSRLVMEQIALKENETKEDILMGFMRYTAMAGTAWIDRGEGKEPLEGAVMRLTDAEGAELQRMTTGEDGKYRFDKLMPGTYVISGDMPAGTIVVDPEDERLSTGYTSIAVHNSGRSGTSEPIDLVMGGNLGGLDVGCVLSGRIGDVCWLDLNGDGFQGNGEPGIPNVKIELLKNGEAVAETVTDQYGFYRFEDVYPAEYTLRVTAPKEVKPTQYRDDIPMIASILQETEDEVSLSVPVTVISGKNNYNADLGFVCRKKGVLPAGIGAGKTQDWTLIKVDQ